MAKKLRDMRKNTKGKSVRKNKRTKTPTPKPAFPNSLKTLQEEYKKASSNKPPDKIKFYSIKERLPPNRPVNILYFDPVFGYGINISSIILQHIHHDIDTLKFSRTTHWAFLKTKKE